MAFDLDDAEYDISQLQRAVDELSGNLAKMLRRLDNIEPKANRTYNFLGPRCATTSRAILRREVYAKFH